MPETHRLLVPAGFILLRTPLLPLDDLISWAGDTAAAAAPEATLQDAIARDRALLRERLRAVAARAEVREALFVASPSLERDLAAWEERPESEHGQRVERGVVRYFTRMASRATPLGLCAGVSLGHVDPTTSGLRLEPLEQYRARVRLDMSFLAQLGDRLAADPRFLRRVAYVPNTSLYVSAERVKLIETRPQGDTRTYELTAFERSPAVAAVLARAVGGARFDDLVAALRAAEPEAALAEAEGFVEELIASQVLVGELAPPVTGEAALSVLSRTLKATQAAAPEAAVLDEVTVALTALGDRPLGGQIPRYRALLGRLRDLPAPVDETTSLQVDLLKPASECCLSSAVLADVARAVEISALVHRPENDPLREFKRAFLARYDQREVPLPEALDAESGVGFGTARYGSAPLLEGLEWGAAPVHSAEWIARDELVARRIVELERAGQTEWVLSPRDVTELSQTPVELPNTLAVLLSLESSSGQAGERSDFRCSIVPSPGASGVELLARFCHLDPEIERVVVDHVRQEQAARPEAILAELVHLPGGRGGNVVVRPVLREYEIAYLGRSGAAPEQQLAISDLGVFVRDDRVRLRSRRLGREVLIRHTNAHHPGGGADLYRFLSALHSQDAPWTGWRWGPLGKRPFLPRITVGRTSLALARWILRSEQIRALESPEPWRRHLALRQLRHRIGLPRYFSIAEDDQVLFVDSENSLSVDSFLAAIRSKPNAVLEEVFPQPGRSACHSPEGTFQHEVVVPFRRSQPRHLRPPPPPAEPPAERSVSPGGSWLYFKVYCGRVSAGEVLRGAMAPALRRCLSTGAADAWFFLRYADPEWHLRVRVRGSPQRLWNEVGPELNAALSPCIRGGSVWRVQIDTYEREVERYGGAEAVAQVEEIFWRDSEAAIEMLARWGDDGEMTWRLALRGMDLLLEDFGLTLEEKLAVASERFEALQAEVASPELERQVGVRFRTQRDDLNAVLEGRGPGEAVLRARGEAWRGPISRLHALSRSGQLAVPMREVVTSLLHLHVNRVLSVEPRLQEWVLCDYLRRIYASRQARLA